ncbi:MAG TPA: hypothetical protein DCZ03_05715 [Gammaproteobacteria bacterium]|nr:hypothetical protein [Gammaproteobacteria bacterium]
MDLIERAAQKLKQQKLAEEAAAKTSRNAVSSDVSSEVRVSVPNPSTDKNTNQSNTSGEVGGKLPKQRARIQRQLLQQQGMIIPGGDSRSKIKEEYRHIKRPLLANIAGRGATVPEHLNLIMVTSAVPNEGKTFNAMNLALSIAEERDKTVLLVDGDIVKPALSKFFEVSSQGGLVDYLNGEINDVAEVIYRTDVSGLSYIPAGRSHFLSTELLAGEQMRRLVEELATRYQDRIVIFDSPPLLATSESHILASLMAQIMVVVRADTTPKSQVQQAIELLDRDMNIGFVLNQTRSHIGTGYYEPYYYGYYGD